MFLRQLSSSSSSFLPQSRPALSRAGFRSSSAASSYLPHLPAPHPWWSSRGFPPWPPHLPHPRPAASHVLPCRTLHSRSINPNNFSGSWRLFFTSAGWRMERADREPPHKRRKSAEERRSVEERERPKGGARGTTQGAIRGSKKETDHPQPNHRFKCGSGSSGSSQPGRGVSKEISSDKSTEWTRTGDKQQQWRNNAREDQSAKQGNSTHHGGGPKSLQPSRTQLSQSGPEQVQVSLHRHNAWFKEKGRGEAGAGGREGQKQDSSSEGGQWARIVSLPCHNTLPPNPVQRGGAPGEPPPPGTSPPVRQQEDVQPVKPLQRCWETLACSKSLQPPAGSKVFEFSVMSYNILSQELLEDNAYLYRHCDPAVLPWMRRLPNLLAEIRQLDADILCLQEVQEDHYQNQIKPALQAQGYQCVYKKRTGSKPDGCAVIFKSSRLSLLSSNPVEFFRRGDALLDRDNVGLVVLLQPKDSVGQSDPSSFICVANTHLLYNPRRGDIKLAQLAILLAEIDRLSRLPDGSTNPVVLCGDFNSTPWSPLYNLLTLGCLDYRGLPIGSVSGQEVSPRGQRLLTCPIWSPTLGIDQRCQYTNQPAESSCGSPSAVEGAISSLTVEDVASKVAAAAALNGAWLAHNLKLQSTYQHRLMPDGRPEITTCHSRTALTVDYILYTPERHTPPSLPGGRGLQLLGRLSLVGRSELEEVDNLPNRHHSSDHLPLLARFRLKR